MPKFLTEEAHQVWLTKIRAKWKEKMDNGFIGSTRKHPEIREKGLALLKQGHDLARSFVLPACIDDVVNTPEACEQLKSLTIKVPPAILENILVQAEKRQAAAIRQRTSDT